ncbi:MAG TPA: 50S ribosomal protein L11 [Candidatus Atribacteria bacterium]|nr:50S ribosomal protein L11 [Candidatus Aenigmarchaeota archaeon]HEC92603.1 50S ribosomal protein L11 [Candidatus Atribacteria bacterium]
MGKQTIDALVQGGKASAGPPLGPALGPLGVNIGEVIKKINEKTAPFVNMDVPIKVIVDDSTKEFEIKVGSPPITSMIKKELNVKKLRIVDEEKNVTNPGSISLDAVIKIAKAKEDALSGDLKAKVKQVLGTCISGGVLVDGKNPREIQKEIDDGKYDDKLK